MAAEEEKEPAPAPADASTTRVAFAAAECPVASVTVYADRAEVTRHLRFDAAAAGSYDLVLRGVTKAMNESTLRVRGAGDVVVQEVSASAHVRSDDGDEDECDGAEGGPKSTAGLRAEAEKLRKEANVVGQAIGRVETQRDLVQSHAAQLLAGGAKAAASDDSSGSAGPLSFGSDFSRAWEFSEQAMTRVAELDTRENELKEKLERTNARLAEVQQALGSRKVSAKTRGLRDVSVLARTSSACTFELYLSYVVSHASWEPAYDVRVDSSTQGLSLTYYGAVRQSTGEDWVNCRVSLSTAQPAVGGTPPSLPSRTFSLRSPHMQRTKGLGGRRSRAVPPVAMMQTRTLASTGLDGLKDYDDFAEELEMEGMPDAQPETAELQSGATAATFTIPRLATINSDNQAHRLTVQVLDLESTLSYRVVPEASQHCYLRAMTHNTSEYPLLASSDVSVFVDGDFVTRSEMNHVSPGTSFSTYLGTDPAVKVKYFSHAEERGGRGWLTRSRQLVHRAFTDIRNARKEPITVTVAMSLPVSDDPEHVTVAITQPPEADLAHGNRLHGLAPDGSRLPEDQLPADASNGAAPTYMGDNEEELLKTHHVWQNQRERYVEWTRHIEPATTLHLPYSFTVEWPQRRHLMEA